MTSCECAEKLIVELKKYNIKASIYKIAKTSNSIYVHFKDERIGKCRISDHEERGRYGYRWQIRTDIIENMVVSSKGHKQFYFPSKEIVLAARCIKGYYDGILRRHNE